MIRHVFKRVTVQVPVVWAASSAALAAVADQVPNSVTPDQMFGILASFVIVLTGTLVLVLRKWLIRSGPTVQRSDTPSSRRVEHHLVEIRREIRDIKVELKDDVKAMRGSMDTMTTAFSDLGQRVSRMEGCVYDTRPGPRT